MFSPKINSVLKMKELSLNDGLRFQGWIEQYFQAIQNIPLLESPDMTYQKIVHNELPTIESLLAFLKIIRKHYYIAAGNAILFKKSLFKTQPLLPPNHPYSLVANRSHNQYYRLFNILSTPPVQIPQIVTFSVFDKLLVHIIFSWCIFHQKTIDLQNLFSIIDQINGDYPTKKNHI